MSQTKTKKEVSREIKRIEANLGNNLKSLRLRKELSQDDLSRILGVARQQIQKYESGENCISVGRLVYLCEKLDVTLMEFLSFTEI